MELRTATLVLALALLSLAGTRAALAPAQAPRLHRLRDAAWGAVARAGAALKEAERMLEMSPLGQGLPARPPLDAALARLEAALPKAQQAYEAAEAAAAEVLEGPRQALEQALEPLRHRGQVQVSALVQGLREALEPTVEQVLEQVDGLGLDLAAVLEALGEQLAALGPGP
ncbi:hypothetical protein Y1Q_0020798 [Alligator mississippiensis]|uniref:Uncharacterized protein n=1 Tax=Alligator mississippiensis TaxID=8496 RepID=A0A151PBF6_ALLMI|nr:hypothetical protein Y1Q_0020798 [Alligator mississippiensis]